MTYYTELVLRQDIIVEMNDRANQFVSFPGSEGEDKVLFKHKRERKETLQAPLMKLLLPSYQNKIEIQQKRKF